MRSKKQGRVADLIQKNLSDILQFETSDPRLGGVTIIDVDIDRELMYATIYVTSYGGEDDREEVLAGLESASGFLRRELAGRVDLRHVPELRFKWDETVAYAARIDALLDSLDLSQAEDDLSQPEDELDDDEYD
ncbi:MAG: 30S ribosome-binding factor RbfA [Anaerolineae bacterium]|nr:30S ribosome-binding factor RbfA [Anaerolineae bacterium]